MISCCYEFWFRFFTMATPFEWKMNLLSVTVFRSFMCKVKLKVYGLRLWLILSTLASWNHFNENLSIDRRNLLTRCVKHDQDVLLLFQKRFESIIIQMNNIGWFFFPRLFRGWRWWWLRRILKKKVHWLGSLFEKVNTFHILPWIPQFSRYHERWHQIWIHRLRKT